MPVTFEHARFRSAPELTLLVLTDDHVRDGRYVPALQVHGVRDTVVLSDEARETLQLLEVRLGHYHL